MQITRATCSGSKSANARGSISHSPNRHIRSHNSSPPATAAAHSDSPPASKAPARRPHAAPPKRARRSPKRPSTRSSSAALRRPAALHPSTVMAESLTLKWLRQNIQSYAHADVVYAHVESLLARYPSIRPKTDVYSSVCALRPSCTRVLIHALQRTTMAGPSSCSVYTVSCLFPTVGLRTTSRSPSG